TTSAEVRAATMSLGSTNAANGQTVAIPLIINSGTSALGGYAVTISFSTNLLQLIDILGGSGEFSASPSTINTNTPGQVRYIHQQSVSITSPTGTVLASQVRFTVVGTGGNTAALTFLAASADDTDGFALPITATNNGS